ncbi:MAG TPA: co-chaperone GroES family protein [Defluviitoga tunisiensis]|nr:co-chaperone GroES family protein [Defluviitoga tunisiensis]
MKLLQDYILITKEQDFATSSGLIIDENEVDLIQGRVTLVGEDVKKLKVGDKVFFSRYAINELEATPEKLYILKEDDVIGIL